MKKFLLIYYIAVCFLTAVCAAFLYGYVHITAVSLGIVAAIVLSILCAWLMRTGRLNRSGRIRIFYDYDFKYSKSDGDGSFDVDKKDPPVTEAHIAFSSFLFIISAMLIPFAVFFQNEVKLGAIGAYGTLILIETFVEILVISLRRTKALADMQKHEKEEAERLRREQEQREQMGKWK